MSTEAAGAMLDLLRAVDRLLALHGEALTERSVLTLTRRPGLVSVAEADIDDGARPVLIVGADVREPGTFGRRLDEDEDQRSTPR